MVRVYCPAATVLLAVSVSTLVEAVGFHLAQECFWYNPAKMPAPAEWVTVRRIRVRDSVEYVWWLSKTPNPKATEYFISEWKKRGFDFAGCTESFRGYDGIRTAAAAIEKAGKADPAAIKTALWGIDVKGLNGDIVFKKSGPEGKESGQSQPNVYLIEISDGKIGMKTL